MKILHCRKVAMTMAAVLLLGLLPMSWGQETSGPGRDAQALQDFHNRVQEYMKIRQRAAAELPRIISTSDMQKVVDRRHRLAAEIIKLRGPIQEGNVFTPEVDAYFDRLIHSAYQANTRGIEATLECFSPVKEGNIKPNDKFPEGVEVPAMPATVLLHVPQLPAPLEYRIINKDMIIRDRGANLIVDILRNAVTPPEGRKLCEE